jgi:hypothetical protein
MTRSQSDAATGASSWPHPLKRRRRDRIEAPVGQEPKFAPLRVEHLHACEVGTHDGHGGVEDFFVQHLNIAGVNQLGADFLQLSVGGEFRVQLPLGLAQCLLGSQTEAELASDGDSKC